MEQNTQIQSDQELDQEIKRVEQEIVVEQEKQSLLKYVLDLLKKRKIRTNAQAEQRTIQKLLEQINKK